MYTGMTENSGEENQFHYSILQSLDVIQHAINNLSVEQELFNKRLASLESQNTRKSVQDVSDQQDPPFLGRHDSPVAPSVHVDRSHNQANIDYQRDYECIRDSLAKVKLPNELKLLESKSGIKRPDQPHFTTISKCARYTETCLKL